MAAMETDLNGYLGFVPVENVEEMAHKLKFSVCGWSSFAANFHPTNIMEDKPHDQNSRWSSETYYPSQYIILKLEKPATVTKITFGKYQQNHVCNLKKFKVFGSMHENHEHMMELLQSGLKNDNVKETFELRHKLRENLFPVKYIKIVPRMTWGPSFNFSIWFVELIGVDQASVVKSCSEWINTYREQETIRLCLKHFRQRNYTEAFQSLKKKTKVELEHPILSCLHEELVVNTDFDKSEEIIERAANDRLFNCFISKQDYIAEWTPISSTNSDTFQPGMRGGHQMCIDTDSQLIYLFGGWDGNEDLADFWMFNIHNKTWQLLSSDTEQEGGPCARSCHKMCLDHKRKLIFSLGRYLDSDVRNTTPLKSDFFVYNVECRQWTLISEDTAADGGPPLIFDHQMCVNVENNMIYVFGGRVLANSSNEMTGLPSPIIFSGLYCYHTGTNTWTKLRDDCSGLRSRIGHSMLFYEKNQALYIFAGQREREFLNDFTMYNTETDTVTVLSSATSKGSEDAPAAGFTQRATIDPESGEIHVLSGLSKDKIKREESARNSFWIYNIESNKWSCIYRNENTGRQYWTKMQHIEPCPRFAHQLAYDHVNKVHYLFGGNPGKSGLPKMRLDDFWSLKLTKPSLVQLLRRCKYLIRKQRFYELVKSNTMEALTYLQHDLSATVDHDNEDERREFELLTFNLFTSMDERNGSELDEFHVDEPFVGRSKLFDQLVTYFPDHMTQPKENLADLIII